MITIIGLYVALTAPPDTEYAPSRAYLVATPIPPAGTQPALPSSGRVSQVHWLTPEERLHQVRVQKCRRIVSTLYPNSGFLPYCEVLVTTHERLEREGGPEAAGFGSAWWYSLVYGGANFSLQVGGVAPGNCAGPMDVKHWPLVLDPVENIEWHCREMLGFWKRGVRGRRLCECVFYPAAPRDWGGGRFRRTESRHRMVIERGSGGG